jgi:CheY-like chemotaxis protein
MVAAPLGKRVLVIDDDFATREMLSIVLAGDGYRVAAACNGADAFERLRSLGLPDLILLDLKMPVMDGCTFCRQRQQDQDLAAVPLLVLSAVPDSEKQVAALGATGFLRKPFDPIDLLTALRKCCS